MARAQVKPTPIVVHEIEQEPLPKVGDPMRFAVGQQVIYGTGKAKQACVVTRTFLMNAERAQADHRYYLLPEGAQPRDGFIARDGLMRPLAKEKAKGKEQQEGDGTE